MIKLSCEYLPVRCISLYVIIMSRTSFRVNPHTIFCLNVKELLVRSRCHVWTLSDSTQQFGQTDQMVELFCEYLSVRCIWRYVIIMSRTSFRVNPHPIFCLNVKELLASRRLHIWSLSNSKGIRTHNDLVREGTINHLAKLANWLSCVVSTYVYGTLFNHCVSIILPVWLNGWVFIYGLSGCGFESRCCQLNFRYGVCFEQGVLWHSGKIKGVDSLWNSYMTW